MIVGPAFGASALVAADMPLHAQHGTTVLVGVESDVTVNGLTARAILVPPDVEHTVKCEGPVLGFLYDCETLPDIERNGDRPRAIDPPKSVYAHRASLFDGAVLDGLGREIAPRTTRRRFDKRVQQALEALRAFEMPRLAISSAHLQELFARDIGIPMRTYRLWLRLLAAAMALRTVDATRAAHLAGFSDLAHFSRTCRRMLGYSPSDMRKGLAIPSRV
jgi:AraC-like DNA-binding protein